MNWKNILTKGLPVVGILLAVCIGFAVASRPKAVPKVSNPNEVVVDFHGLKVKKNELYELMKTNYALNLVLQDVDSKVLSEYYAKVDNAEVDKEINKLKGIVENDKDTDEENAKQLQSFYDSLVYAGLIKRADETDSQFEDRIRTHYKYTLNLVQKEAAKEVAKNEIIAEETKAKTDTTVTDPIKEAMDTYTKNRDICVISLEYDSLAEREAAVSQLKDLTTLDALKAKFKDLWEDQPVKEETNTDEDDTTTEEPDFFEDKIVCPDDEAYERLVYDEQTNAAYRDFVFATDFTVGTYKSKLINSKYYVVLKADIAKDPASYTDAEKAEFRNIIINRLVDKKTTTAYIKEAVAGLRADKGFKIFDYVLAENYAQTDDEFEVSKSKNKQAVYELDGQVTTTDQLYERLKVSGALSLSLDKVYFAALSQIDAIQLTKEELKANKEQIAGMKTQFLQQGYDMTWADYIKLFGANSEKELGNLLQLDQLTKRFVLGYTVDDQEKYAGKDPVLQSEIDEMYTEWFEITASHILFSVDEDAEDQQVEKNRAELLAKQVIRGVKYTEDLATALLTNEEFIRYDYNGDGKLGYDLNSNGKLEQDEMDKLTEALDKYMTDNNLTDPAKREAKRVELEEYFKGLINTPAADYTKVFQALAKSYSDDTGSATNGGSLGAFGPKKMVKEFEDAAKKLAETRTEFPFSNLDKDAEGNYQTLAVSEFGYHVLYVTGETKKPAIPAGFEGKTIDQIRKELATTTNTALKTYFDFIAKFETSLEEKHMSSANVQKHLVILLEEQGFKFNDPVINDYYAKLVEVQKRAEAK